MEEDFNNIKQWLEPKLLAMGLSVEQFARKIGLTRAAVYFYMNDFTRPSEQTMVKMCRVLGVPFEEGLAQYTPRPIGRPTTRKIGRAPRSGRPKAGSYNSHLY